MSAQMAYLVRKPPGACAGRWLPKGVAAAVLAALFLGGKAGFAENEVGISLDEITRRLTEWRSSFVNLHVVWDLKTLPESNDAVEEWPPPPDPATGDLFSRQEWIWADHGLDLHEKASFFYEDGSSKVRVIDAFNGPKGVVFRAQFEKPLGSPEVFRDLLLRGLGTGKPTTSISRAPARGLYWPSSAAWLPEVLSEWKVTSEGSEKVVGELCSRISAQPVATDAASAIVLWVDLNHGCLVRRYRSPTIPQQRLGNDFVVDEFQLVDGVWFPKRGRLQLGGTPHENQMFIVTKAEFNQSLDLSRFEPPKPAVGTVVDDHGKTYKYGEFSPREVTGKEPSDGGPINRNAESTWHPSAAPPATTWVWSSAGLVAASVIFLTLGFLLSRRKKEDRS